MEDLDVLIKSLRDAQNETEKRVYASLIDELVKLNIIVDEVPFRDEQLWIDAPPPEKDLDLGIGERYVWQTPIHKEAGKER